MPILAQTTNEPQIPAFQVYKWIADNSWETTAIIIAALATFIAVQYLRRGKTAPQTTSDAELRHLVARSVLHAALFGVLTLGVMAILFASKESTTILNVLLPLFGTWVGTLLAYYFGKDNFESGAKTSADIVRHLNPIEKLRSIPAAQPGVMIPIGEIKLPTLVQGKGPSDYGSIDLKTLYTAMEYPRLPLIDPKDATIIAVAHKSLISEFLLRHASPTGSLTLKSLLDEVNPVSSRQPGSGQIAKSSFVCLPRASTLADVKQALSDKSAQIGITCEDAFLVSAEGKKVEGWITNDILEKFSHT